MSDDFFKPEDFMSVNFYSGEYPPDQMARSANAKLAKHIEGLPVVYNSHISSDQTPWMTMPTGGLLGSHATHVARLWGVEEIVKAPCEHKPKALIDGCGWYLVCHTCGKQIKPKGGWEIAE